MVSFNCMPSRKSKREAAENKISELNQKPENCLAIYCSFADIGQTKRVTSIAVRNLSFNKTETFSIYKTTEQEKIAFSEIDSKCDFLERAMLKNFFAYAKQNPSCTWIHWEMQDDMYGFPALEHRYKVLGGKSPEIIPEDRKFDLGRAIIDLSGGEYIKLENLTRTNGIQTKGLCTRKAASEVFEKKEFKKLHESTLRGVRILTEVFEKLSDWSITTNAKSQNNHLVSISYILTCIKRLTYIKRHRKIIASVGSVGVVLDVFLQSADFIVTVNDFLGLIKPYLGW